MQHVAIDLGSRESQVCIRDATGEIVREFKHSTRGLGKLMEGWEPSRVVLETSAEAFAVADQAIAANHTVAVVPARLVKELGVGSRKVKTDRRDAQILSLHSHRTGSDEMPSVHIPSTTARELKALSSGREALVTSRTKLVNNVRGLMRTELITLRGKGSPVTFPSRVRARYQAELRSVPVWITPTLGVLENLNAQIKALDSQFKTIAKDNPITRLLMTMPGVGPVTAIRFLATLDDVGRFQSAHGVAAYLGLTPGRHQSGEVDRRLGISKAGSRDARKVLVQAAWTLFRTRPLDPMVVWAKQIAQRRGTFIAIVALARKLSGVLFAMWRDGTPYRPLQTLPQP